jgi:hypothetical protein
MSLYSLLEKVPKVSLGSVALMRELAGLRPIAGMIEQSSVTTVRLMPLACSEET